MPPSVLSLRPGGTKSVSAYLKKRVPGTAHGREELNVIPPGRVPPQPETTRGDDEVELPPGNSQNATPGGWPGKRAAGDTRLRRPATGMQICNANMPGQMRPALTKRHRQKPTKWFGRRLSVSIACLFWTRRRQQAAPRASSGRSLYRSLPSRDGQRRCDCNRRRAPRICARLHNLTPSCARTCCHCTQPCCVPCR